MREVTLIRKKTFVASLGKVMVYIQSSQVYDLFLEGVRCKRVGLLKNGQLINFEIPDSETILFVVFDQLLPERFHSKYIIPSGKQNIILYTKPKLKPREGNPFVITDH